MIILGSHKKIPNASNLGNCNCKISVFFDDFPIVNNKGQTFLGNHFCGRESLERVLETRNVSGGAKVGDKR